MTKTFEFELSDEQRLSIYVNKDYDHFAYGKFDTEYERYVTERYCEDTTELSSAELSLKQKVFALHLTVKSYEDVVKLKNEEIEWYRANAPVKYHEL